MEKLRSYYEKQNESLTKAERLQRAIQEMIRDGIFQSGDAIPPHRKIADELNIALGIVTNVCNSLKKSGLLYGERGRGSFIVHKTTFAHDLGDRFQLDESWLEEEDRPSPQTDPILCNVVERLQFMNLPPPKNMNFTALNWKGKSLKDYGAAYLFQHGLALRPDDVTISHNAYVALWTAFQLCCPAGTVLGVPYLSFIPLFRNKLVANNVRLVPIDSDQFGILPESLENACYSHGLNVITLSPECELPTTSRMGRERRMKIAQIARKHDLTIIEHCWLLPDGTKPELPALAMYAPERTIFLEHASKMLSCENFCSFSYVPQHMREQFIYLRNIMSGPLSHLSRKITAYWIETGLMKRDFDQKNIEISSRNQIVKAALEPIPVRFHKYARFCWLPLAKDQSGAMLRESLQKKGVLISSAQNYIIGSTCPEDGILIGIGYEPSILRLKHALGLIRAEIAG